jgi:hypothetical protein
MGRFRTGARRAGSALAAAALLSACGTGGQQGEGFEEFFGTGVEAGDALQRMEEATAACMQAQGFDYEAVNVAEQQEAFAAMDPAQEDFAATYGYGITSAPEPAAGYQDPNEATLAALAPDERAAWEAALWGEEFMAEAEQSGTAQPGGCMGQAEQEVFGEVPAELEGGVDLDALVREDPDYVSSQSAWARCMNEAGYDYATFEEPPDAISARMEALLGQGEDPAAVDTAALEELRAEELAVAAADEACRDEHFDAEREEEIYKRVEAAFIAEHRDAFEQLRDGTDDEG